MSKAVIICVDDEPAVLESLRRELSETFEEQCDLETAEGGEETLELVQDLLDDRCQIALVIADYLMPGIKGDEVLCQVHHYSPKTLNIMLTGQAGIDGITNAINHAKLYRYIAKPWGSTDLKLTVKEALTSFFQRQKLDQYHSDLEQEVEARTQALEIRTHELSAALNSLQQAQSELIRAEKMSALGNLVAGVAHEINTPVGNAILAASVLAGETATFESHCQQGLKRSHLQDYLTTAQDSSQLILGNLRQAADLIQSFKQVAVDQSSHKPRTFKLVEYLHSILTSLEPQLRKTPHEVSITGDADIQVTSFPGAISQVVTNFVMNSLSHAYPSNESGRIHIEVCTCAPDRVCLTYSDDGCGIAVEDQDKVFEPFFTTARDRGGSGLGLHVVHNVVTQTLKGSIQLESSRTQGTTFTLNFPCLVLPNDRRIENE